MTYTPVRTSRNRSRHVSDWLERQARRVFRPLCGSLAIFTLLYVQSVDQTYPTLYAAAKWTTVALLGLWLVLAVGAVITEPEENRS